MDDMIIYDINKTKIIPFASIDWNKGSIFYNESEGYLYYRDFTEAEKEERRKNDSIAEKQVAIEEKKAQLAETDYVVIKMYEAVIRGEDITEMKSEYSDVLNHRQQLREQINELEEQIKSLI